METIKEVSIVVTGLIRSEEVAGAVKYDWVADHWESDEWYDTAEDAERGFINHYS
jgi:hypothetical protein